LKIFKREKISTQICFAITKAGNKCNNKVKENNLCGIHKNYKIEIKEENLIQDASLADCEIIHS
jgi:hypothetical protein